MVEGKQARAAPGDEEDGFHVVTPRKSILARPQQVLLLKHWYPALARSLFASADKKKGKVARFRTA